MSAPPGIRRLPQVVADSIAAGEVVERPASVVKELVENALDAGARRVDVTVEGGGLVRIEVVDDGGGIAASDVELAVARHATSKIAHVDDLRRVRTLGFRGEALASIAAVSDMRLVSGVGGALPAAMVRLRGGDVVERATMAAPNGTRVEVCDLFAATPARLAFLRSAAAESAAGLRVVTEMALLHHETAFVMRTDGRETLRTPGGSLRDALRAVYGDRAKEMLDVVADGPIAVSGALGAPHTHRANRGGLVLAINRRRIVHRGLQVAVEEAYRGLIPTGRYPFGVLLVDLDPADVDVNVHPAKREVRLRDERAVFSAVQRACWSVLQTGLVATPYALTGSQVPAADVTQLLVADSNAAEADLGSYRPPAAAPTLGSLAPLHAVGQIGETWLVAESSNALVVVDPHAAHEKTIYTELMQRWTKPNTASERQLLLIPALIPCDAARAERLERHHDFIESIGFSVEPFGPDTMRCTAVPAAAASGDAERLVVELIDTLDTNGVDVDVRRSRIAALVACHSAVRFGDRLEPAAQQQLLDRLMATPGGMTCPHGRPTLIVLDDPVLRRAFRRPAR